jgi:hypothetical protein
LEDSELEGMPAGIHRFRAMPLPDEIAKLATALVAPQGLLPGTTQAETPAPKKRRQPRKKAE